MLAEELARATRRAGGGAWLAIGRQNCGRRLRRLGGREMKTSSPGSFAARAPQFSWQLHTLAGFVAASIAFFAAMGGAYYASFLGVLKPFNLDGELTNFIYFPAIF